MVGLDLSLSLYKACPLTPIFYCNTVIFSKRRYSSWSNSQGVLSLYQESTLKTTILSYFLFWVCQIQSFHGLVYCTLQVRICLYCTANYRIIIIFICYWIQALWCQWRLSPRFLRPDLWGQLEVVMINAKDIWQLLGMWHLSSSDNWCQREFSDIRHQTFDANMNFQTFVY